MRTAPNRARARTCLAATDERPLLPADNVAWEDPRIDQHLLRMGAEDTLLVLTTGGCNVLLARRAPALPLRASATGAWPLASRCPCPSP